MFSIIAHNIRYAPCGDNPAGSPEYRDLLAYLKGNRTTLDAWSWHSYSHGQMTVDSVASALYGGSLDAINSSPDQCVTGGTLPLVALFSFSAAHIS